MENQGENSSGVRLSVKISLWQFYFQHREKHKHILNLFQCVGSFRFDIRRLAIWEQKEKGRESWF